MNDQFDPNETEKDASGPQGAAGESIFDLFEPPPPIDPNKFGPIPVVSVGDERTDGDNAADNTAVAQEVPHEIALADDSGGLPDWTAPATGQVPAVVATQNGNPWDDVQGPSWKGDDPQWAGEDLREVFQLESTPDAEAPETPEEHPPVRRVRQRPRPELAVASSERNVMQASAIGVALAAIALLAIRIQSDWGLLAIVCTIAGLGSAELYNQMRVARLPHATLLGIVACVSLPLAVYYRGADGFLVVIGLTTVFGAIWYLADASKGSPIEGLGQTFVGVMWIGVLSSFAVLLFRAENEGHGLLLAAIVVTVAADVGGYAIGRAFKGRLSGGRVFHPASPKKTWEGMIGGVIAAVLSALVLYILELTPFKASFDWAIYLGLVGGTMAPLGDLTESMIKRDLGIKDMGTLIPGHGGVLDRMDGMLFVVPGVYYLSLLLGII